MAFQPRENAEPIPGYALLKRLGVGGYGEVWKVSAPGGLTKAMKIVYGRMDDERGARELKALGRIKEVRHPFLLSLERFDIVDGQLFIVTELADMSLMDRFHECREAGQAGIPRDELLGYLHDASDALDYMSDKYGLQHLDIKPENLLLVGGRVKVADFGLVKDLQDANSTLVGGVTPLYATPEAFDGRASRSSDQYSLAIVYQEMLCGVLPFSGSTTAQLAAQHMQSRPLLGPLSEHDRPIIERALSKRPERRFDHCRQMIDCLLGRGDPHPPSATSSRGEIGLDSGPRTIELRSTPCQFDLDDTKGMRHEPSIDDEPIDVVSDSDLESLELDGDARGIRPTLFIALGGTAALVLRKLRKRLSDRFGGPSSVPCWQMLLIDTDADALRAAERGAADEALSPNESVFVPLRRAANYRNASERLLSWLSRRWLYNIPRSLRTEGLRPLGRLAFVDHAQRIADRVRLALAEITSPEAKSKSAITTGMPLRSEAPRVFVVSSICGGTGGGMIFDVAFAVRELLAERGCPVDDVCGVLMHGTSGNAAVNDLRKANAYAALTEWNHYQSVPEHGQNPASAAAPETVGRATLLGEPGGPPFGDTYLIDLGDTLSDVQFGAAVATVARYLYLDAATACGAALDRCRALAHRAGRAGQANRLRTFGLHVIACDKHAGAAGQADLLCEHVVGRWHGEGRPVEPGSLRLDTSELNVETLSKRLLDAADKALSGKAEVHFRNLLAQKSAIATTTIERDALARIDALLGAPQDQTVAADATRFGKSLGETATKLGGRVADSIVQAAAEMMEQPSGRLPAALSAVGLFQEHLRLLRREAEELCRQADADAAALRMKLVRGEGAPRATGKRWFAWWGGSSVNGSQRGLLEYCDRRLRALVYKNLLALLQSAMGGVTAFNERLVRLRPRLEQFGFGFKAPRPIAAGEGEEEASAHTNFSGTANSELTDTESVLRFDEQVQRELLQPGGGLLAIGEAGDDALKMLRDEMRLRSRAVTLTAMREIDAARLFIERHADVAQRAETMAAMAEKALPRLMRHGGAKRLLAILPASRWGSELASTAERDPPAWAATIFDVDTDVVLCYEAEELSPARVARALIDNRPDCAAAARRVLTRVDIRWASFGVVREPLQLENPSRNAMTIQAAV
jgi:serine/threonine protein kinase